MKECPNCHKKYSDSWGVCLSCRTQLEIDPSSPKPITPKCQHCNSEMIRDHKNDMSIGLFVVGLLLAPVIIGIPLIFMALGGHKTPIWKCPNCGSFIQIAVA